MGLDKVDTIVKLRMAQKMEFLFEDVAAAHEPTTQELKEWFAKNGQKFALPNRATFRHLFFGFDRRGKNAQMDALSALAKLSGEPEDISLPLCNFLELTDSKDQAQHVHPERKR